MIPATAHFIWFGTSFPWVYALALRTAAERGGFDRVILHAEDDLTGTPAWSEVAALPNVVQRRLDPRAIFDQTGLGAAIGDRLWAMFQGLEQPAARANMIRAAILAGEGGVYLDTDTVTLHPLDALRAEHEAFCGLERIVLPYRVRRSKAPHVLALAGLRLAARDLCRRLPDGWRAFRALETFYPLAANNAVLASAPGGDFIRALVDRMAHVPPERQRIRFALGTHLLQETVDGWTGPGLTALDPSYFYPIGPEISEHWFRQSGRPNVDSMLRPNTCIVHWYASVRTKAIVPRLDRGFVRRHAHLQPFSALVAPLLGPRSA